MCSQSIHILHFFLWQVNSKKLVKNLGREVNNGEVDQIWNNLDQLVDFITMFKDKIFIPTFTYIHNGKNIEKKTKWNMLPPVFKVREIYVRWKIGYPLFQEPIILFKTLN